MFKYLGGLERIKYELRSISLDAVINPRATLAERKHWAIDLRKGKLNVFGGLLRFFDLLAARDSSNFGRPFALVILGLLRDYVDAVLPEAHPAAVERKPGTLVQRPDIAPHVQRHA